MSTFRTNTITDVAGGNSMPIPDLNQGRAKAWLNMNGTGTVAVRDSFNVSSIVDGGTGNYTANLTSPMSSADYVILAAARIVGTSVIGTPNMDTAAVGSGGVFASTNAATPAAIDVTWVLSAFIGDTP
jgi:hypothetical protein